MSLFLKPIEMKFASRHINIIWLFFYLFCFFIPLSQYFSVRILFVTFIAALFLAPLGYFKTAVRNGWDLFLYLLVLLLGMIYTDDIHNGFKILETSFSILAIPFIIGKLNYGEHTRIDRSLIAFCLGLFVASFITLINAFIAFDKNRDISSFFFYDLTAIINIQPTYFAYYLIFGISFLSYSIFYKSHRYFLWLGLPASLLYFIMLTLSGGQTAFVGLLLVFSFFLLKYVTEEITTRKTVVVSLIMSMTVILLLVSIGDNNYKMRFTDSWERFALWRAGIDSNTNFLFGVGTGDYKMILNQYLKSSGLSTFATNEYNAHNQYIHTYLSHGIIGLIVLGLIIVRPVYLSYKVRSAYGILMLFPFIVYGVSEVFLGRYQGVVFFALLHQLFISNYFNLSPSEILD